MKKYLIILMFIVIVQGTAFSMKFYLANINVYNDNANVELTEKDRDFSVLLYKAIIKKDTDGFINIGMIKDSVSFPNKVVKSKIEASQICELLQIDFLLYGFMQKSNNFYNAEIRLYESSLKEDRKIFFAKSELGELDELINELSDKIFNYLYDVLGKSPSFKERKKIFGGLGLYTGSGAWIPVSKEWWNSITGLVCFQIGINVIPQNFIYRYRNFSFFIRIGSYCSYSLGINKPGFMKSYFNSIEFFIPLEVCFELYANHVIQIGTGPQLQLDIMYQELLYDNPKVKTTATFSISTSAGYEYWFGKTKKVGIGMSNIFDFTFYKEIFIDYKVQFYSVVRIPLIKEDKTGEKKQENEK